MTTEQYTHCMKDWLKDKGFEVLELAADDVHFFRFQLRAKEQQSYGCLELKIAGINWENKTLRGFIKLSDFTNNQRSFINNWLVQQG